MSPFSPLPKSSKQRILLFTCLLLGDKYRARSLTSDVWCLLSLCMCVLLCPILQLLHICIEGWGNWRWSEAFSVDNVGTLLRTIQYKGRTASLIIKVVPLNGVQKQVQSVLTDSLFYCLFLFCFCQVFIVIKVSQKLFRSSPMGFFFGAFNLVSLSSSLDRVCSVVMVLSRLVFAGLVLILHTKSYTYC